MLHYIFVPRGVTATFTVLLWRLTHLGTSVGLCGSPLIPSFQSSGDLSHSGHSFCSIIHSYTVFMVFDKWFPKRGTIIHSLPPAWWFRHHGVAVWAFNPQLLTSRMSRSIVNKFIINPISFHCYNQIVF